MKQAIKKKRRNFSRQKTMLGTNKWIILTIVGGVLLSIHIDAIDLPAKHTVNSALADPEVQSFTNEKLGITIENLHSVPISSRRQLRNLVPPYQEFSNIDGIQFIDGRSKNSKSLPGTFSSFRFDSANVRSSSPAPFRRRSDEYDDGTVGTYPASQMAFDVNFEQLKFYDGDYANDGNVSLVLAPADDSNYDTFKNKIIPINFIQEAPKDTTTEGNDDVQVKSGEESTESFDGQWTEQKSLKLSSEIVRFPDLSTDDEVKMPQAEALTARRSGIEFNDNTRDTKHLTYNPFVPQSYSEELLNFGDAIAKLQRPFNNEEIPIENENDRSSGGNRYYRPYVTPFRDEVTKFGDASGPITAFNHPSRDFTDQIVSFPRTQFENANYYEAPENVRPSRHFFPPKVYTEFNDYGASSQINSKFYHPTYSWKTRQPRVVFPPPEFTTGTNGSPYVANEKVVFK